MSARSTIAASPLDAPLPAWHVYVDRLWDHGATDVSVELRGVTAAECTIVGGQATVTVTVPGDTWWALVRTCAAARATREVVVSGPSDDPSADLTAVAWRALGDPHVEVHRRRLAEVAERLQRDHARMRLALHRSVASGRGVLAELVALACEQAGDRQRVAVLAPRRPEDVAAAITRAAPVVVALERVFRDHHSAAAEWLLAVPVGPPLSDEATSAFDALAAGDDTRVLATLRELAIREGRAP